MVKSFVASYLQQYDSTFDVSNGWVIILVFEIDKLYIGKSWPLIFDRYFLTSKRPNRITVRNVVSNIEATGSIKAWPVALKAQTYASLDLAAISGALNMLEIPAIPTASMAERSA